jgi:hypothetical protein
MRNWMLTGCAVLLASVLTACPSGGSEATAPVIGSFTATPNTTAADQTDVNLAWTVTGADEIKISANIPSPPIVLGADKVSATVTGLTKTTTFTLTAKNATGTLTSDALVTVGVAPTIASSTPSGDGIDNGVNIVVTFSEAMNQAATVAAYVGNDEISKANSTFLWDTDGKVLTINPKTGLTYAVVNDLAGAAKVYSYSFGPGATDLAGNALDSDGQAVRSFKTKRNITQSIDASAPLSGSVVYSTGNKYATDIHVGDTDTTVIADSGSGTIEANSIWKGFAGFDLTSIPAAVIADPNTLISAVVELHQITATGTPYSTLGTVQLEHITFAGADLTDATTRNAAYTATALANLGVFSSTAAVGGQSQSASLAVRDDLTNLAARQTRSTYRLVFTTPTDNDGVADHANFDPVGTADTNPKLVLNYIIP